MKLIIDIPDKDYEFIKDAQIILGRRNCKQIEYNMINSIKNGIPVSNITNAQIGDAIQTALAAYWEEKSKHLTPQPTPAQCCDCPNEIPATESLISRYQHDSMSGVFMARPTEVIKVGEPLSNSEEIIKALEKGEIYKRGFEDGYKRGKEEQSKKEGEWILGERNGEGYDYYCSNCMHVTNEDINTIRFCPNCGRTMKK